ncbi:hypothetical protein BDR03DRAFT_1016298 [Suillus americanus]|nr:hypothetical protein BDR03DRAFT_1016298 [Suillus americanus]
MPTSGIPNLHSVAASLLNPLHKRLPNGFLSCNLNSSFVVEFINDPLVHPRLLQSTGDFNEPWHAYIPVAESLPACDHNAWVFEDTVSHNEFLTPTHRCKGHIAPVFLNKVENTVRDTLSWLAVVFAAHGNAPIELNLMDAHSLKEFHGTYNDTCTELWKLRHSVLVAWGYIIYCLLNAVEDWKQHNLNTPQFVQSITCSSLLDLPHRGIIIQAQDPPPFDVVVKYLHHQIPVHYYWTPSCVHWLDPAALLSVDIHAAPSTLPADSSTESFVMEGPPTQHGFWRAGEFPIFNGQIHKQRVFVTSDSNTTWTEITDQRDLIHKLVQLRVSKLFAEPMGDILLIYDEPAQEISDTSAVSAPSKTEPTPTGVPQSQSITTLVQHLNPYIYFNSDHHIPKVPAPDAVEFITHGNTHMVPSSLVPLPWDGLESVHGTFHADPPNFHLALCQYPGNPIHSLLQLPQARRFVTMGGIMWRIALHYGPPKLFALAISGPSSNASMLIHCESHNSLVDDTVSDEDISLLLGITDCGSLWPTLDLWEKNENWSGEWGAKSERWFTAHIREIARGSPSTVLSRQQWKSAIRRHTVTAFNSHRTFGTEAHADWVCSELEILFPSPEPLMLQCA